MSEFTAVLDQAADAGTGIADFSSSPAATATPAAAPAESPAQMPSVGSAGSAVASPRADASALPSQEAAPVAVADPIADARKVLEASPEYKPIFELQQRFNGGDLAQTLPYLEMLATDLPGFYKTVGEHLRASGQLEPEAAPEPFKLPEADLRAEDGTTAYSAAKLGEVIEAIRAEFRNELQNSVKPFEGIREERESAQKYEERKQAISVETQRARNIIPDFAELEPEMKRIVLAEYQKPVGQRRFDPSVNPHDIYAIAHVARGTLQSSIQQSATDKVKAGLAAKVAASTEGPRAQKASNADTTPPTSFLEAMQRDPQNAEAAIERMFSPR